MVLIVLFDMAEKLVNEALEFNVLFRVKSKKYTTKITQKRPHEKIAPSMEQLHERKNKVHSITIKPNTSTQVETR